MQQTVRNPASGLQSRSRFCLCFSSVLIFVCGCCLSPAKANLNNKLDQAPNLEQFRYCLKQSPHPNLSQCIGRTAISFLQRFDEKDNYTLVDNFILAKDDNIASRSLVNMLDTDPVDFRGILENAGAVISQRSFQWHMDGLYPGLMLKIGPTANANSLVEFIIDPAVDERQFDYQEPSTARLLTRQYLLPFLLGLKFNLVALVPLIFAAITLLLKKSLFLAKLAIYISSILGAGGLASILGGLGAGFGGGLGGPGSVLGFGIGGHSVRGQGHGLDVASAAGYNGYFPGKTTVFNQHYEANSDEPYSGTPYKRSERKVNFDKPREFLSGRGSGAAATTPAAVADRFYEYEKQLLMQDRSGKQRSGNGKLGPSAYEDEDEEAKKSFKPSESATLGWKVVDMRI